MQRGRITAIAFLVLAIGSVTMVGSGAFTSVTAERGAHVNVSGDAGAFLGIAPHSSPNGQTYTTLSNGQIGLQIDGTNTAGQGANVNALTVIEDVVNITNAGSQPVGVWIVKSGNATSVVSFETAAGDPLDNSSANSQTVTPGETIEVTVVIDTRDSGVEAGTQVLSGITIHADADQT